jgi:hypothetical protein
LVVTGATTQITGDRQLDFGFSGIRIVVKQGFGGIDHSGRAETALNGPFFNECGLKRMRLFCGDTFNCRDLSMVCLCGQQQTGMNRSAVQQNSTGTALAQTASFFCTGQAQIFTQHIQQYPVWLDLQVIFFPVDGNIDRNAHDYFPPPF